MFRNQLITEREQALVLGSAVCNILIRNGLQGLTVNTILTANDATIRMTEFAEHRDRRRKLPFHCIVNKGVTRTGKSFFNGEAIAGGGGVAGRGRP